jgi:nucleotide-binding universal stress UspA family protein
MEPLPKCLLLPIDGTEESLRPVEFLSRLYPNPSHIGLILSYFITPLAPIYQQKPDSKEMAKRRLQVLMSRAQDTRAVLDQAKKTLLCAGFPEDLIEEHIEEKGLTVAHHACRLADIKKVDAVVVQRRTSSSLEGFLKADPTPALLRHCIVSPVWITSGTIDPSQAAVCICNEDASLRAADHAGFMLAETATRIDILHVTRSVSSPISSPAVYYSDELTRWLMTPEGAEISHFLTEAFLIIKSAGIDEARIRITILPGKGNAAQNILSYCEAQGIGIVVLGHAGSGGMWGFLKNSVTKKILLELRNMAVWVIQ